jgi:cephalosporin-C deacetylase
MNAIEERLANLHNIRVPRSAPDDFDAFWERALNECRKREFYTVKTEEVTLLRYAKVHRVTFHGFDETPIHGWYLVSAFHQEERCPCVIRFHGYTGSKGFPEDHAEWLMMGMAVLALDVRGQGGETGNLLAQTFGMTTGWDSQGVRNRDESYYKAVLLDAVRAVDWLSEPPEKLMAEPTA